MREVPAALFVLSVCLVTVRSQVRTINSAGNSDEDTTSLSTIADQHGIDASQLTKTLCSNATVPENSYELRELQRSRSKGVTFYLRREDLKDRQMCCLVFPKFTGLLTIPEHLGLHDVMTLPSNMSTEELEAALYFAWLPSIELHFRNTGQNVSAARIVSLDIPNSGVTEAGATLRKITYTLIVSGSVHRDNIRVRHSSRYAGPPLLERIPPPAKDDLIRRLQRQRVIVYNGLLFSDSIVVIRDASQEPDFDRIKRNLITDLETFGDQPGPWGNPEPYERSTAACNMSQRGLDVRIGKVERGYITSKIHGRYTQYPVTHVHYLVTVRNKIYIPRINVFPSVGGLRTDHVSYRDVYSQNQTLIFSSHLYRMYSSLPVNLQLLPLVEKSVAQVLNSKLINSNLSVTVRFTDPDLDNATTHKFWVALVINDEINCDLDPRLHYRKEVYDHLEGLRIDLVVTAESGGRSSVKLSAQPFAEAPDPQRERFLRDCKTGPIRFDENRYGDCPLSETFSLHLMQTSGQFPQTQQIAETVKVAFSEANPITLNDAEFVVSLENRENLFQTNHGLDIVRFDFTFSYFNLTRGRFWNVWRFPTNELLKRLSLLDTPLIPLIPGYLRKPTSPGSAANDASSIISSKERNSAPQFTAGDRIRKNGTFTLYLVTHGALKRYLHEWQSPKSDAVLRAVGDAFTEANPGKGREGHLNITLTGRDEHLWSVNGELAAKFEFTVASSDNKSGGSAGTWQYPTNTVLQQHLQKTASADFAKNPVY